MAVQPSVPDAPPSTSSFTAKVPSSSHRLPTVSASEALLNLSDHSHGPCHMSIGVASVDEALGGGFERGKVTELWGPAGAGQTAVAISRLNSTASTTNISLSNFHHTLTPTLTHLLALLLHPPPTFPSPQTRLLILTNLHASLETSHPRHATFPQGTRTDTQKWAASRRYAFLGSIASALNKLAAVHNIAVIVTTGCATRSRTEFGAPGGLLGLVPGVGGSEWDAGIWTRAVVLQDFEGRFVGVQKLRGSAVLGDQGPVGRFGGFAVAEFGVAVQVEKAGGGEGEVEKKLPVVASPVQSRKRTFDEVADSDGEEEDGEEYGTWAELEEDALAGVDAARAAEVVTVVDD